MEGRVALVTGAGRGIGRATTLALASRGVRVMATARSKEELQDLAGEIPAEWIAESLATPEGCDRVIEETRRRLGKVEILVNNAGVLPEACPVWEQDPRTWHDVMAVNLHAPFELTRRAARDMVDSGWGRIVMVSSTAGERGDPGIAAYTASKHALTGLMRSVAQDVACFGVTCNAVMPGWVRTEMAERTAEREACARSVTVAQVWNERAAAYPAQRVLDPGEVAALIAFLASDEASGINGEAVTIALGGLN